MQVLIAEDDPATRRLLAALLRKSGDFDLAEAEDGDEAAAMLARTAFDLLLLDWDMPGRPGIDVVRQIRAAGSRVPIFMVTATAEREKVLEAIGAGVSDYIVKPFEPGRLLAKVDRLSREGRHGTESTPRGADGVAVPALAAELASQRPRSSTRAGRKASPPTFDGYKPVLTSVLNQIDDVSTIPEMAARFIEAANDPNVPIEDLQELLSRDPAIATRVLRLVNSSAFSVRQKITSLAQAIAFLGVKQVKSLAVAIGVSQLFRVRGSLGKYSRTGLWRHLLSVGTCSRLLADRLGLPESEKYFLAGLLHDLGIVLEDQYAHQQFCQVLRVADLEETLVERERQHLGFDHTTLGERVAERWKFPDAARAAIRHHHDSAAYEGPDESVVRCVELANVLCSAQGTTSVGVNLVRPVTTGGLGLPLDEADLDAVAQALRDELAKTARLLEP